MWSTNVVEFRKVTYYFVVPLLGFFVCKHHSTIWKFLLSHLLTKADSLPWNSTTIKINTRIFGWFKFATSPKRGSNSPPLVVQMPVGLPGGKTVEASNWSTLKSVLLARQRSYKRKFSTSCWSPIWHQIHFTRLIKFRKPSGFLFLSAISGSGLFLWSHIFHWGATPQTLIKTRGCFVWSRESLSKL